MSGRSATPALLLALFLALAPALPAGEAWLGITIQDDVTAEGGMANEDKRFYAFQFHPEVTHTLQGKAILNRFVHDICGCGQDWNMPDYITEAVARIQADVGQDEVILGLSGGVDSSVDAALIHRAIGDQLTCVFVDTGLLRLNEAEQVMDTFARNLGVKVIHVDAVEQFMGKLAGVADPERKRKIIGGEFVEVFQREAGKLKNAKWLAQGTIYPDVIESARAKTEKAHAIKSHHNVGLRAALGENRPRLPDDPAAWYFRARARATLGNKEGARADLDRAGALLPPGSPQRKDLDALRRELD